MQIVLPYGAESQSLEIPSSLSVEILESTVEQKVFTPSESSIIREAMRHPVASQTLGEMARGKRSAVILCSDHTRPVPSRIILPCILEELRRTNPEIDITLLIATGLHRSTTRKELSAKFGEKILKEERIEIHDCTDKEQLCTLGRLPSGAPLTVNRLAVEADLLLAEGFIEPHFFAGFSGGRKSVLPGICGRETVLYNHCASFIDDPHSRTGILAENPIHRDMLAGMKMAGLDYIVNVVLDKCKRVVAAFAGEPEQAHLAGCHYLEQHCRVTASQPGDIIITSNGGAPLDQNVYQAVKGMTAAESVAAPGACIIMCAACNDGMGGDTFFSMLRDCTSPGQLLKEIGGRKMEETWPDQWQAQILARVLHRHKVLFVCDPDVRLDIERMKMTPAADLETAFRMALAEKGEKARIIIIPDGVSVIPGLSEN